MSVLLIAMTIMETLDKIPAGLYALIGTVVGSVGLKVVEKWLNKNKENNELRRDLHQEIKDLIARVDEVENEVSQWRIRAYAAEEQVALLRIMVIQLGGQLPETVVTKSAQEARDATE